MIDSVLLFDVAIAIMSFKRQFDIFTISIQFDMIYKQQSDMFLCVSGSLNVG